MNVELSQPGLPSQWKVRLQSMFADLGALSKDNFIIVAVAGALVEIWLASGIFYGLINPGVLAFSRTIWILYILNAVTMPAFLWYLSRPKVNPLLVSCTACAAAFLLVWYVVVTHRLLSIPFLLVELFFVRGVLQRLRKNEFGDALVALTVLLLIVGGWFVSACLAGTTPFDDVVLGKTGSNTFWAMAIALLAGTVVGFVAFARTSVPSPFTRFVDIFAVILFVVAALRPDISLATNDVHVSFFLGPADTVRHGGTLLWDVPSQYGILNIWLIAHLPFPDVYSAFTFFNATITFITAIILYAVLRLINRSPLAATASAVIVFSLVFIIAGVWYVSIGFEHFPQVGGIRWIWAYVSIALLFFSYIKDDARVDRIILVVGNICWLLAMCWSAESGIYATCTWFLGSGAIALRRSGWRGVARTWATAIALLIATIVIFELFSRLRTGHGLDWFMALEFGLLYQGGAGSYPFETQGPFWVLGGVFGVLVGLTIVLYRTGRTRALPLAIGLCGMLWAVASYFVMRSHPNNVNNLIQFQILALAAALYICTRERMDNRLSDVIRLIPIPIVAVCIGLTFGTASFRQLLVSGAWGHGPIGDLSALARPLSGEAPELVALLARNKVTAQDPINFINPNGNAQLPPYRAGDHGFPSEVLPILPPAMINQLPVAREVIILQRFADAVARPGYLLDTQPAVEYEKLHEAVASVGTSTDVDHAGSYVLRKWSPQRTPQKVAASPERLSFVRAFDSGSINSNAAASTPTGKGVFVLPVPYRGHPTPSIVVLGGFTYTYSQAIKAHDILTFALTEPLKVGEGARAFVDVRANDGVHRIFERVLDPAPAAGPVYVDDIRVPLNAFSNQTVQITFGALPRGNDDTGCWALFADPKILGGP
jgi:hypothetical protein